MMKRNITYFMILNMILFSCTGKINQGKYPYQDAGVPVEKRMTDLIARMTVDEKIHQPDMYWVKEATNIQVAPFF